MVRLSPHSAYPTIALLSAFVRQLLFHTSACGSFGTRGLWRFYPRKNGASCLVFRLFSLAPPGRSHAFQVFSPPGFNHLASGLAPDPPTATYDRTGGKKRIPEGKILVFLPFTATGRPDPVPGRSLCLANPITCLVRRHWQSYPTRLCTPPLALRKPPASPQNTYRSADEKRFSDTSAAGCRCRLSL